MLEVRWPRSQLRDLVLADVTVPSGVENLPSFLRLKQGRRLPPPLTGTEERVLGMGEFDQVVMLRFRVG